MDDIEEYEPLHADIVNAINEEFKRSIGVLLAATLWSIPDFNHNGIKIKAPPIPKAAPTNPAKNPPIVTPLIVS